MWHRAALRPAQSSGPLQIATLTLCMRCLAPVSRGRTTTRLPGESLNREGYCEHPESGSHHRTDARREIGETGSSGQPFCLWIDAPPLALGPVNERRHVSAETAGLTLSGLALPGSNFETTSLSLARCPVAISISRHDSFVGLR